jgi:hypothetical protein
MKIIKHFIVFGLGLLSALYLINIGAGVFELIPDNIPIIGNLDEAAAALLLLNCLAYFGLDLRHLLRPNNQKKNHRCIASGLS